MVRFVLLLLLVLVHIQGQGAKYWVSTSGSDANPGTQGSPVASVSFAAVLAQSPGDTIFILPGTYQDNNRVELQPGVHILGSGINATFIYTTYDNGNTLTSDGYIRMYTSALTQNGLGQSLSHFTLKGCSQVDTTQLLSQRGIVIWHRENVAIHHVRVANFEYSGIVFWGTDQSQWLDTAPTYYQRGNSVHHCQVHNCATNYLVQEQHQHVSNCLRINGQQGFLCYGNNMSQTGRTDGLNHDILGGEWNRDLKIFYNNFTKKDTNGGAWHFFFELFRWMGGGEIHDNMFKGNATADIVCVEKDNDDYGLKIYNNTFDTYNSTKTVWPDPKGNPALDIENRDIVENVEIYNNEFRNVVNALWFSMYVYTEDPIYSRNIKVHHNRFLNIGASNGGSGRAIWYYNNGTDLRINTNNIQIYQNSIEADGLGDTDESGINYFGICYRAQGRADSIIIRNNIVEGASGAPGLHIASSSFIQNSLDRTITNLIIQNNCLFNNGHNNEITFDSYVLTPQRQLSGNLKVDPLFVNPASDLHLQAGSPAIDSGHLSLPQDPDGTRPDMGAMYFPQGPVTPPSYPEPDYLNPVWHNGKIMIYNQKILKL